MRTRLARALSAVAVIGLMAPVLLIAPTPASAAVQSVVTHTVTVGTQPRAIAITPDGRTAVVANNGSNTVSIIDVESGVVTHTVIVGTDPRDVAISPDGTVAYIVVQGISSTSSTVQWVNIATGAIVRTLAYSAGGLNQLATSVIVSPDGQFIYVYSTSPSSWLVKVQTGNGAVLALYSPFRGSGFGSSITDVALSSDGLRLAFSPRLSTSNVDIVDTATMTDIQSLPLTLGDGQVNYSVDGASLFVTAGSSNQIAVTDTSSYSTTRWSSGGTNPTGIAAADSGTIFVTNQTSGTVASLREGTTLGTAAVVNPQTPILTDTQEHVLVLSQSGNALAIINTSNMQRELIQVGTSPVNVATARRYAVVANAGSNTVSIIRLAELPASGDNVPKAPLQQFGRTQSQDCTVAIPDSVLFPGVGEDQRRDAWGMSWAEWPNGGTGGFVCTRQPYYTNTGRWSVT